MGVIGLRGFRAILLFLRLRSKVPNPTSETRSPRETDSRITSMAESIMRPMSALLAPVRFATSAISPLLFTSAPPRSAPAPYAPDGPLVNAALACNHLAHEKGSDTIRFPDPARDQRHHRDPAAAGPERTRPADRRGLEPARAEPLPRLRSVRGHWRDRRGRTGPDRLSGLRRDDRRLRRPR